MKLHFSLSRLVLLFIASALLSACGQKGPLYLPAKPPANTSSVAPASMSTTAPAGATLPVSK